MNVAQVADLDQPQSRAARPVDGKRARARRRRAFRVRLEILESRALLSGAGPEVDSLWGPSDTPAVVTANDPNPIELGVQFQADVGGFVNGVRFYKGPGNTGTHLGSLWAADGTLLARATFAAETASGWQQVNFASPVHVDPRTTYVASYHTDAGQYSYSGGYFNANHDAGHLHALATSTVTGGNGVHLYGPGGFPTRTYNANNYWVDVAFTPDPPESLWGPSDTPAVVTANDPNPIELGVQFQADVGGFVNGVRFYKGPGNTGTHLGSLWAADGTLLARATFAAETASGWQQVNFASPVFIRAGATYVASYHTNVGEYSYSGGYFNINHDGGHLHAPATSAVAGGNGVHLYGPGGFPTRTYNANNYWVDVAFTPNHPDSLWGPSDTPAVVTANDPNPIELGVQFQADVGGFVNGVRFYKGPGNTGTHLGSLWAADGTLLARATFAAETASGWQQVNFASPVFIRAGATYVASYHTNVGEYSYSGGYFNINHDGGHLHAPATSAVAGGNGVHLYGPGGFPTRTYNANNYWVDVAFTPGEPASPPIYVSDTNGLKAAIAGATPGTRILLRPGVYSGDIGASYLAGAPGNPIVIAAADPTRKPVIQGGVAGLYLSSPSYIELRDLIFQGASVNGLNIDDGASGIGSAHDIVLSGLEVRGSGYNGIKFAGVDRFQVDGVTVQGWSAADPNNGGSAIDLVGCHDGEVATSLIQNTDLGAFIGIMVKGGSANVTIRDSRFEHAGRRAMEIGGSTDPGYFRPAGAPYEAKDITVEGNVFIGSQSAVIFSSIDGATFRFNTVYRPSPWVIRILQEDTAAGIVPSRNGVFTDNIVVFRSDELSSGEGAVNIGAGTDPSTFQFARNWWYALDNPAATQSRLHLPTAEVNGTYGVDPLFVNAAGGDFHLQSGSPARAVGAYAPRP